ncbi:alpha/beta hydrolase [Gordonia jinhuaensis]|uniref:Lipase/esterase (LipN) n=2 Tax=Gordonia jinhuaensis TaxID=1517702 RepID=A0A916TGZ4_9ACTN|nr:putative lipase/esterase (LipN) [Gordonia jinhuaensis]
MPTNAAGDRIAPEMYAIATSAGLMKSFSFAGVTPEEARRRMDADAIAFGETFAPFAIEQDLAIDGPAGPIPAVRYRSGETSRGLVVFFHGGGWVVGSPASHAAPAKRIAARAGVDVVSVDYRLAPENPFPAAVDDALAAWRFAVATAPAWGLDPRSVVLAGDSAGGNLSAVVAQQVRGDEITPALQVLIYPVTDLAAKSASYHEFSSGFYLTEEQMNLFREQYVPANTDLADPRISPLRAADVGGVAPAHVVVAGFDPLRDEGLAYAEKLRAAGVPVSVERAGSMIHGFANLAKVSPESGAVLDRIGDAIIAAL